jgi:hypothetical protein
LFSLESHQFVTALVTGIKDADYGKLPTPLSLECRVRLLTSVASFEAFLCIAHNDWDNTLFRDAQQYRADSTMLGRARDSTFHRAPVLEQSNIMIPTHACIARHVPDNLRQSITHGHIVSA